VAGSAHGSHLPCERDIACELTVSVRGNWTLTKGQNTGVKIHAIDTDAIPDSEARMETTLPGKGLPVREEFFELERERIFFRDWCASGVRRRSRTPAPTFLVDLLGESLLVVRTREGDIGCFHQRVPPRGSRLVIYYPATSDAVGLPCAAGRFKGSIVLPVHSWTYGLAGELRNAPFLNESDGFGARSSFPSTPSTWRRGAASSS